MTFDDAVGPELLDTTLADKHMATVLPKFVLVTHWQIVESLVTDITRSVSVLSLTLIPSSNKMHSLTNQPSSLAGPCASR